MPTHGWATVITRHATAKLWHADRIGPVGNPEMCSRMGKLFIVKEFYVYLQPVLKLGGGNLYVFFWIHKNLDFKLLVFGCPLVPFHGAL